jgi:Family of unknown function (DUF6288)/HEAT repeats
MKSSIKKNGSCNAAPEFLAPCFPSPGVFLRFFSSIIIGLLFWSAVGHSSAFTPGEIETKKAKSYNLGPTGALGWMETNKNMTENCRKILITAVEVGSPAVGKLEVGDVVLGVFGNAFTDDARKAFGRAIGQAEADANGLLPLTVLRNGVTQEITIKLPYMGAYSETSPYECPKTNNILKNGLAIIAKNPNMHDQLCTSELALLAAGRAEDLPLLRKSAQKIAAETPVTETLWKNSSDVALRAWRSGYKNLFLCEYYLATGDRTVLPAIRAYTTTIARGQGVFGTWGHDFVQPSANGQLHGAVPPYGCVNAIGIPCFISLILAQKCGVTGTEMTSAIDRSNKFLSYYIGKGSIPYGENRPFVSHDDNGKNSMAAVAFALQGKRTETQYFAKMVTGSYETRELGHTGNGFSYLWGPIGANCGGPKATSAFMKELRWYFDLARRWDGSFVNVGHGGGVAAAYKGAVGATATYMLAYSVPLRKIYLTGRDSNQENWLTNADIASALDAERCFGNDAYPKRPYSQLFNGLSSWSPVVRLCSAEELVKRPEAKLQPLLDLIKTKNQNSRLGAVTAIGKLKNLPATALDTLAELLQDNDRSLRLQAVDAIRNIGDGAKPIIPQMLKSAAVKDRADPMQFSGGALAFALFYGGGASGPAGLLSKNIANISKDQLYPAIRTIAENPDSAARGCLGYAYNLMTLDDIKALAPTIVSTIRGQAPANTMFSKGVRLAGITALGRLHIEEGIPLTLMMMELHQWGEKHIVTTSIDVLKEYRGAAKSILPQLKKLEIEISNKPDVRVKLAEVITLIENDTNPPKLISLKNWLNVKVIK